MLAVVPGWPFLVSGRQTEKSDGKQKEKSADEKENGILRKIKWIKERTHHFCSTTLCHPRCCSRTFFWSSDSSRSPAWFNIFSTLPAKMDVTKAVSAYIERIISSVAGMKVLLLDAETTPIISTSLTQSSLLSHEVYLTDRIENTTRDRMRHLKCITLLRPSAESIAALETELKRPKYSNYSLFFTNTLKKADIERLAEADEHDVVKEVQVSWMKFPSLTNFSLAYYFLNLKSCRNTLPTMYPSILLYSPSTMQHHLWICGHIRPTNGIQLPWIGTRAVLWLYY